ncbi:MAG: hypothetical protein VB035_00630 [Candidatus Fimivivens sp.]|nr:hypothetical protein [Candidatus Fimivivens sp.]
MMGFQISLDSQIGAVIISACVAYLISRRQYNTTIAKERLEKIISPVFETLSPYLFCSVYEPGVKGALADAVKLVESEPLMAGGVLRMFLDQAMSTHMPNQRVYDQLCYHLENEYRGLCRTIGIPIRPWKDRWVIGHLGTGNKAKMRFLLYSLPGLLLGVLKVLLVFSVLLALYYKIFLVVDAASPNKLATPAMLAFTTTMFIFGPKARPR